MFLTPCHSHKSQKRQELIKDILGMMDDHFLGKRNLSLRNTFYTFNQKENECMHYLGALAIRQLAQSWRVQDRQENGPLSENPRSPWLWIPTEVTVPAKQQQKKILTLEELAHRSTVEAKKINKRLVAGITE